MGELRLLTRADEAAALAICGLDPVVNVFVASRISKFGVERATLGCDVYGYFVDDQLRSLFHVGANLVPVNATPEAVQAFVAVTPYRRCSSLMGPAGPVLDLYHSFKARHGGMWAQARAIREDQPLMLLDGEPAIDGDPRVTKIGVEHYRTYLDASVAMYTEELGVSPLGPDSYYPEHVRQTITQGRAFGIVDDRTVIYKSDVGVWLGLVCQIQGVWLDPKLRGRGLAAPAMAEVARIARRSTPLVSLYVNNFNTPAIKTYERVGFQQVGQFATVLY